MTNLADKIGLAQYQALRKILSEKPPTSLKKLSLDEANFIYRRRGTESLNVFEEYIKPLLEQLECLEELKMKHMLLTLSQMDQVYRLIQETPMIETLKKLDISHNNILKELVDQEMCESLKLLLEESQLRSVNLD